LSAKMELLAHLMSEPCFNQLRTNEQLGYLVWSGQQLMKGVLGLRVIVQSADKPADFLEQRIEAFLQQFKTTLASLSAESYQINLAAVIAKKLEKDKTLNEETNRHWGEIAKHKFIFNRVELEVEVLRRLQLRDLVEFYNLCIAINSPHRAKFAVQVFGCNFQVPEEGKFAPIQQPLSQQTQTTNTESTKKEDPQQQQQTTGEEEGEGEREGEGGKEEDKTKSKTLAPPPPVPEDHSVLHRLVPKQHTKFKRAMSIFPHLV